MGNHRKSITEVHQLGRREGAPRPGHEPTPSPRAGHLSGSGHLLPMRGGGGGDVTQKAWGFPCESGDLKLFLGIEWEIIIGYYGIEMGIQIVNLQKMGR